jgi:uncharacterized protein YdcH (DUF465 family)
MTEKPRRILKQFQEKSHTIAHLMGEDSEFLALCEDYDACVEALRYWEHSREPEAKARVNEYRTLVQELEEEIRVTLEAQPLD